MGEMTISLGRGWCKYCGIRLSRFTTRNVVCNKCWPENASIENKLSLKPARFKEIYGQYTKKVKKK